MQGELAMTNQHRDYPEPAPLWRIFEMICSVPHPSGQEKALAETLSAFAREDVTSFEQLASVDARARSFARNVIYD